MTDWAKLQHAFGPASDIPDRLAQLKPGPSYDQTWFDLWSCLCHQGSVYSASFAALPTLLHLAKGWPVPARLSPLALAAAIVDADFTAGGARLRGLEDTVEGLRSVASESLAAKGLTPEDFATLLDCIQSFERHGRFGNTLKYLASGEVPGECPACDHPLYFVIGKYGFFCTADYGIFNPSVRRMPILPAVATELQGSAKWLYETAERAHQTEIANWTLYLAGATICPSCEAPVQIAKAAGLAD